MKLAQILFLLPAFAAADTVHYTYDSAGRLTRADYASGSSIAYTYDPSGNLLNRTVTSSVAAPQINAVTNAASFQVGPVAPCEIVTLFGLNLDRNITFDNTPATVGFFSAKQANVTVPCSIAGPTTMVQSGSSPPLKLDVSPSAPGIFAAVPVASRVLTLYTTGGGNLSNDALPLIMLPVSVAVNNQPATVLYAGAAPGLGDGANQINIQVPDSIPSGAITIVLTVGAASSQAFKTTLP